MKSWKRVFHDLKYLLSLLWCFVDESCKQSEVDLGDSKDGDKGIKFIQSDDWDCFLIKIKKLLMKYKWDEIFRSMKNWCDVILIWMDFLDREMLRQLWQKLTTTDVYKCVLVC